ncbi:hypothetical protein [Massilia glaciei]|uniref:Uncharacterized protein n=1 Tax=Massilia glaciei TaxID=1524097 RepID=A0A2U2HEQ3_9BURK|nr:hypothetical protein [Massilia glaciei]PWF42101.1 hypothetical protein C7C56_023355 [Massilia glaciei]
MQIEIIKLPGLSDMLAASAVARTLSSAAGVGSVSVCLAQGCANVLFDQSTTSRAALDAALLLAGYPGKPGG